VLRERLESETALRIRELVHTIAQKEGNYQEEPYQPAWDELQRLKTVMLYLERSKGDA
jgi:hypothetical protein